ncbi:hypothetical protein QBC38DRAFT_499978 [Podospora fimiseda]|uniref:Uncharacterized protein n=1 Tax=Podospora fimiseda TaxID=252190 RepID=A0AAN7BPM3_9PEZI|nr:hypothetical protein QBC38DRAFT_499978 [Podospora fimiseda]
MPHLDNHSKGPGVNPKFLRTPSTSQRGPLTQKDRGKTVYKELFEVCMRHGDMMVMSGTQIQKLKRRVRRLDPSLPAESSRQIALSQWSKKKADYTFPELEKALNRLHMKVNLGQIALSQWSKKKAVYTFHELEKLLGVMKMTRVTMFFTWGLTRVVRFSRV